MSFHDDTPRAFRDDTGCLLNPFPPEPEFDAIKAPTESGCGWIESLNDNMLSYAEQDTILTAKLYYDGTSAPAPTYYLAGTPFQCSQCSHKWARHADGTHASRCPKCKSYDVAPIPGSLSAELGKKELPEFMKAALLDLDTPGGPFTADGNWLKKLGETMSPEYIKLVLGKAIKNGYGDSSNAPIEIIAPHPDLF